LLFFGNKLTFRDSLMSEQSAPTDPWPLSPADHMQFSHYLATKKVTCYPYERFCEKCQNTWLKQGNECLRNGHEFSKLNVTKDWVSCIVFYDGYRSCYHGSKKYLVSGRNLKDKHGQKICDNFGDSPFGR